MKNKQDANFLPKAEKRQAKEALQKQSQSQSAEMKLVIPEMNNGQKQNEKKESFWERRKRKKAEKKAAKLRKKGETGSVKEALQEAGSVATVNAKSKAALFENTKQEQPVKPTMEKPVMPKPERKEVEKPAPKKPVKPVIEKKEAKKVAMPEVKAKVKKEQAMPEKKLPPKKQEAPKKEVKKAQPKMERKAPSIAKKKEPTPPNEPVKTASKKMHQPEKKGGNYDGPSVNLVPDTMMPQSGGPTWILGLIIITLTIAFWVIIGGIGVSRAQRVESEVAERNNRIMQIDKTIAQFNAGKDAAETLQKQFDSIEGLINDHLYWTPVLQKIEENTLPDVYYTSINADITSNVVSLRAIAKNYEAAARQIRAFELVPDTIASVSIGEARVENQPEAELPVPIVAFDLELTLTDGILTFVSPDEN